MVEDMFEGADEWLVCEQIEATYILFSCFKE